METMSTQPAREGFHDITPTMVVRGAAAAIEFYGKAFGATTRTRMDMPDGKIMHSEVVIGDSIVMLTDEFPDWDALSPQALGGTPVSLYLTVKDVDTVFNQALAAGATVLRPLQDQFWGDRVGWVLDPFGHKWGISTHFEDVPPDEVARRGAAFAGGAAS